jgi:hypothetical protein
MPYIPHVRITARFALGSATSPRETASCTLAFSPTTIPWVELGRQAVVNDAFDDWANWVNTPAQSRLLQDVALTECRLYMIGADGRMTADVAVSEREPVRGTVSRDGGHPWQCTNVVTLVAGTRGKGRFGRIYLPPQSFSMLEDGTISSGQYSNMFDGVETLLTNLSELPGVDTGFGLVVAGRTGTGTLREVTEIRLGHVADTQRRRRRSLDEAYTARAFSS